MRLTSHCARACAAFVVGAACFGTTKDGSERCRSISSTRNCWLRSTRHRRAPDVSRFAGIAVVVATFVVAAPALGRSHPPRLAVASTRTRGRRPGLHRSCARARCEFALLSVRPGPAGPPELSRYGIGDTAASAEFLRPRRPGRVLDHRPWQELPRGPANDRRRLVDGRALRHQGCPAPSRVVVLARPDKRRHASGESEPEHLHDAVFGDSWLLFGITVAGLWGIWRGLVQRRASETLEVSPRRWR